MDHLHAMLQSNLDDFVACQICSNGCILSSLANDIGFIGLCRNIRDQPIFEVSWVRPNSSHRQEGLTLSVHAKSVLITACRVSSVGRVLKPSQWLPENCDGLQRQFMCLNDAQLAFCCICCECELRGTSTYRAENLHGRKWVSKLARLRRPCRESTYTDS